MPSTPPSSQPQQPPDTTSTNGLFRNGQWLCNCIPREPARFLRIKKPDSPHHGKQFYTCPKGLKGNHCDMFILHDEAQRRQRENLISNGRTEMKQTTLPKAYTPRKAKADPPKQPRERVLIDLDASDDVASSSTLRPTPAAAPAPQVTKGPARTKTADWDSYDTTSDEDDYVDINAGRAKSPIRNNNTSRPSVRSKLVASTPRTKRTSQETDLLGDLSDSGAEEMLAVTEASAKAAVRHGKQREAPITPSAQRTTEIENGLPTPSMTLGRSQKKVLFNSASEGSSKQHSHGSGNTSPKRQRMNDPQAEGVRLFGTNATIPQRATVSPASAPPMSISPQSSPSPVPSASASACAVQLDAANLTSEMMALLKNEDIAPATRSAVRNTLEKYVNQAKGFERGRDASRRAVKEVGNRNAELQAKVDELEKGRQECKTAVMELWHKM